MGLLCTAVFSLILCIGAAQALRCMQCSKRSKSSCQSLQSSVSCGENDVCSLRVRLEGGTLTYEKGCRNKNACWNHQEENPGQCRDGYVSRECSFCCSGNDCNKDNFEITFKKADDCKWWSQWGTCSAGCGIGLRVRSRSCENYKVSSKTGSKKKSKKSKKTKTKSKKSCKTKSKKSKSKSGCSEAERSYQFGVCIGTSCEVRQKCHTCKTPEGRFSDYNCQDNYDVCEEGQGYCLMEYSAVNSLARVSKRCASLAECSEANADGENWSAACAHFLNTYSVSSKISTSENGYSNPDAIVGGTVGDASASIRTLAQKCAVCCKGNGCDKNYIPAWNTVLGSASTIYVTRVLFIVPLLVLLV